MKITKITVKNLFGIFNHEIPLNTKEHITIVHGPNGFGKTVLLKMLNALFSLDYQKLRRMPFDELALEFGDKSILKLKRNTKTIDVRGKKFYKKELLFEFKKPKKRKVSFKVPDSEKRRYSDYITRKRRYIEVDDRFVPDLVTKNIIYELSPHMKEREKKHEWLKEIINSINIRFIETQRLLKYRKRDYEGESESSIVPAVSEYSNELVNAIQKKLAEYATLSQSLDRDFPMKLVTQSSSPELKIEELQRELNKIEEKRSRLVDVGLLDREEEIDFKKLLENIDESNRNVLSVYIEDVKKKLSVFDGLYKKIYLLMNIINTKFLYKQLSIDKEEGFIFKTPNEKKLSPKNLSSGEQHELVLFYELLFKVSPNSLILIDEPELSLHVLWQHEFLKDLQDITKLADFDVLIATHSPQIIHDQWDLTVELEGPKNE